MGTSNGGVQCSVPLLLKLAKKTKMGEYEGEELRQKNSYVCPESLIPMLTCSTVMYFEVSVRDSHEGSLFEGLPAQ